MRYLAQILKLFAKNDTKRNENLAQNHAKSLSKVATNCISSSKSPKKAKLLG
ncbi:hypothetical protein [Helicobacter sp. T3_23-1056]